jgi:type I restriction enzyme M protein
MDDMDAISEEFDGKRTFFAGEYARYGWAKLMHPSLGGHETLNLYAEGITKMPENPGIPPLFREIFKNAFLPYRDPETLRAFLKIINEFSYDHSERLGDAFEYLLSVLGSQGDAGQFRTPRHIIDFMVAVINPQKTDRILDPACGTAGFLISAYKHVLKANETLAPDEKEYLAKNLMGYDISPDMVRLSLVNMYLHGLVDPHIYEYDTLTSEDRWNETADVILANPPFMSPKGGIRPHNRFGVQSKRSEVLFVDYMAEHLAPGGRAGIIVPEGIIFQSQTSYKQLRKMLVDEYLVAVVSLPAGIFQPYSGVKTSILILDKALAKKSETVAFFKIENDGFGLGAQRRAIEKNDLPQARSEMEEYLRRVRAGESLQDFKPSLGLIVEKEQIAANGDYNLSGERYRGGVTSTTTFNLVPVGRFMKQGVKTIDPRNSPDEIFELWSIPAFDAGRPELLRGTEIGSQKKVVEPGDVLLSRIIPHIRRGWVVEENSDNRRQIASTEWIVFSSDEVVPGFLRQLLVSDFFHVSFMQTISGVGGSLSRANPAAVGEIQIPLPPLDVQQEIVAEIEGYQKIINGARAVLNNYRPHIPIHPEWPIETLSNCCQIGDGNHSSNYPKASEMVATGVPFIRGTNLVDGRINPHDMRFISHDKHTQLKKGHLKVGDVIFTNRGEIGKVAIVDSSFDNANLNSQLAWLRAKEKILPTYLLTVLQSPFIQDRLLIEKSGATLQQFTIKQLSELQIPLPPLSTQQAIVVEIEAEQALVAANRELIARFEAKIQSTLARIWGEETTATAEA